MPDEWQGQPHRKAYLATVLCFDAEKIKVKESENGLEIKKANPETLDGYFSIYRQYIITEESKEGSLKVYRKNIFRTTDPLMSPPSWSAEMHYSWEELDPADPFYDIAEIYREHGGAGGGEPTVDPLLCDLPSGNSLIFDGNLLAGIMEADRYDRVTEEEYGRWEIARYCSAPTYAEGLFILQANPGCQNTVPGKDYCFRFIVERQTEWTEDYRGGKEPLSHTYSVWAATYRNRDDRYINSRRILYLNSKTIMPQDCHVIYHSILFPKEDRLVIEENMPSYMRNPPMPVRISAGGRFEDFPEVPFSTDTIAVPGSGYPAALSGKLPPDETWTLIYYYPGERPSITEKVTENVFLDHIGQMITLLPAPADQSYLHFDLALKGKFPTGYFGMPEETDQPDDEKGREIMSCIRLRIVTHLEYYRDYECRLESLTRYTHMGTEYWFGKLTFDISAGTEWTVLVGITPDYEMTLLADRCLANYYLLRMGKDLYVYTFSLSCGEGAFGETNLWKMDGGKFEQVYNYFLQGD